MENYLNETDGTDRLVDYDIVAVEYSREILWAPMPAIDQTPPLIIAILIDLLQRQKISSLQVQMANNGIPVVLINADLVRFIGEIKTLVKEGFFPEEEPK